LIYYTPPYPLEALRRLAGDPDPDPTPTRPGAQPATGPDPDPTWRFLFDIIPPMMVLLDRQQ